MTKPSEGQASTGQSTTPDSNTGAPSGQESTGPGQEPNKNDGNSQQAGVQGQESGTSDLTPEQLRAELEKARKEAAAHRKEKQKLSQENEEFKREKMTEQERQEADRRALEERAAAAEAKLLRRDIADEFKIPAKAVPLLQGATEREIRESAEALSELIKDGAGGESVTSFDGGSRGTSSGSGPTDMNAAIRAHLGR